ncbi:MAG: cohesin domain-containing protein [Candidatus Daviesbacteria bacterium]|nr:cohesin domain-containing protein [Candidatus Daviesbacteria bacterium]
MKHIFAVISLLIVLVSLKTILPIEVSKALFTSSASVTNNNISTGSWPTPTPVAIKLLVNHQNVSQFSAMPDTVITQASALKMMFRHASVGSNINDGLNALTAQNTKYNRTNWSFQARGNPGWQAKVDDFDVQVALQASTMDVLSQKFCYIDQGADWNYYRTHMEALMAAYPTKKFIWWTMPIMTSGDPSRDAFNNNLRTYAATHNIILFDLAAIESHDPAGNAITSGGLEAMYPAYSSDGGHLTAAGSQRVAQAFWVMMARISGWDGVIPTPTPTSTPTPNPYAANTRLDPASTTISVNQNFTVNLMVTNAINLGGFDSTISFNPANVEFVSASLGSLLNSTGRYANPLGPIVNNTSGTVGYGSYSLGSTPAGPNGDGVVASFTFRAKASGSSNLNLSDIQVNDIWGNSQLNGQITGGTVIVQ